MAGEREKTVLVNMALKLAADIEFRNISGCCPNLQTLNLSILCCEKLNCSDECKILRTEQVLAA